MDRLIEMEQEIKSLKKQLKELEDKVKANPTFERVEEGDWYYYIDTFGRIHVNHTIEDGSDGDNAYFVDNNYFHTEERAQEVADKIRFLLKLERLHDIYCPGYAPKMESYERKWCVAFNHNKGQFEVATESGCSETASSTYFPNRVILNKVCDTLNKELRDRRQCNEQKV